MPQAVLVRVVIPAVVTVASSVGGQTPVLRPPEHRLNPSPRWCLLWRPSGVSAARRESPGQPPRGDARLRGLAVRGRCCVHTPHGQVWGGKQLRKVGLGTQEFGGNLNLIFTYIFHFVPSSGEKSV